MHGQTVASDPVSHDRKPDDIKRAVLKYTVFGLSLIHIYCKNGSDLVDDENASEGIKR